MSNASIAGVRPYISLAIITGVTLTPGAALACACGCGVFDVGTSGMLPTHEGGMAFLEYDFMNQDKNWNENSRAPSDNNPDKNLKSEFFTAGAQYMWSRAWGGALEVPFTSRHFVTTDDGGDTSCASNHSALGDIRLKGIYSGFSADMSSGVTFGVKLPTGDYSFKGFDRDTAIGSGSTDILLDAYHMGNLTGRFNWFANGQLDQPVLITAGYRPGTETDAVTGVYYNGWNISSVKVAPVAQIIGSYRMQDHGPAANPANSGYERILLSPGLELDAAAWRVYGDVELPVYQHVRGNQLVASELFKINISRGF